ncbi:CRISPR-associated endoribonuclease Cse3 protein [Salinisphaera shabanensis E1L3A]|uniref:CRISPR-associated endoribonuclease Cse3 protein n=1 Tax=Salinisphaera shabanensis E1L3A TaxID=1033802 RepID=F7QBQ3_9GAMM|nr:type I-E CRISPR-associated protein Cas6/Cse3/CasE [Salinisphaera shabanensis]ERJ17424.1 CRISPR-associated endoribonuclease Cse3 protein [Salinisphaera shabanensis E1L3A]
MFLTRLTLDLRHGAVRRDLADAYDMHRSLVRAFVTERDEVPPRFLWRVEPESVWRAPVVMVQSTVEPDWRVLGGTGYFKKAPETKEIDPAVLIELGRYYRFRLFANPTVTQQGKRYGLQTEPEQQTWLERKAAKCGFEVQNVLVTASDVVHVKNDVICLQQACFEGVLKATEACALENALKHGIGPGKAFGFGLLSLAPR